MVAQSIMFTEIDFDRLSQIVESPRFRTSHAQHVHELRRELDRGQVVPPMRVPKGVVTMNSRVRVRDLDDDEVETYTLVYPDAADIENNCISVLAPLGTALLGKRSGEIVELTVPAGLRRLKVERILYQPEAGGDFHL